MTPSLKCSLYGILYGLCFSPPLSQKFQFFSFLLRITIASIGLIGLMRIQKISSHPKIAFYSGFCFGFSFIFISLFGIYKAFFIVHQSLLFLPCLSFLAAMWGGFLGLIFLGQRFFLIKIKKNEAEETLPIFALSFLACWFLFEYGRSLLFFAFPWNLTSHLFCFENITLAQIFIQIVHPCGLYLLSTLWCLFLISFFCSSSKALKILSSLLLICIFSYGEWQLFQEPKTFIHPFKILMIQPNTSQKKKLSSENSDDILDTMITMTEESIRHSSQYPDIIIWPETAITHMLYKNPPILFKIQKCLSHEKTYLIFGADRIECLDEHQKPIWHNSMYILSQNKIEKIYDKIKLLPFGEYIPLRAIFPKFFNQILQGIDCTPGKYTQEISLGNLPPFSPKICSESMYQDKNNKAQWILQILNDGWFALPILWQHLAVDRLRAVEANLPFIRVANTGITAYIDEKGKIKEYLQPHCSDFIFSEIK